MHTTDIIILRQVICWIFCVIAVGQIIHLCVKTGRGLFWTKNNPFEYISLFICPFRRILMVDHEIPGIMSEFQTLHVQIKEK